jgi:hypothetical protein
MMMMIIMGQSKRLLHIGKGEYYGSWPGPATAVWCDMEKHAVHHDGWDRRPDLEIPRAVAQNSMAIRTVELNERVCCLYLRHAGVPKVVLLD